MKTSELLHYAFRADDPQKLGAWYAELFEAQFFIHPVMSSLGIVILKLNHPEAVFNGLLEFWPWDIEWDGRAAVFRRIDPKPSRTSYGHLALKIPQDTEAICRELDQRGIAYRMEPRATGFMIPAIDDPEGNMIELFPNVDHIPLPEGALCPPETAPQVVAALKQKFDERMQSRDASEGYPLLLFEQ